MGQRWHILECVCSDELARQRLEEQARTGKHPARNRDYALYLEVKSHFEEIASPKTVIDTSQTIETCVELALRALKAEAKPSSNLGIQSGK